MAKRAALFTAWALVGVVLSFGVLYAFTPFLLVIVATLFVARDLPPIDGTRRPEALGLIAGPGMFCFVVAASAADPGGWVAAGLGIVGLALLAYAVVGRALCARGV